MHPSMLFFLFVGVFSAGYLLKVDYLGRSGELGGNLFLDQNFNVFLNPDFYRIVIDSGSHFGSLLEHCS